MSIRLKKSTNIHDYREILEGLVDDFGYVYYHAILSWCEIIDLGTKEESYFWQVFLIRDTETRKTIGICGLYSVTEENDELWLGWFGVLKPHRNGGIGTEVLRLLEKKAVAHGASYLKTYVDKNGKPLNFYYRNGFDRISSVGEYLHANPFLNKNDFEDPNDHVLIKPLFT